MMFLRLILVVVSSVFVVHCSALQGVRSYETGSAINYAYRGRSDLSHRANHLVHNVTNIEVAQCRSDTKKPLHLVDPPYDVLRIIIAGPAGSGKGTHAPKIVEVFGVKHLSTGDMLRDALKNGTPQGLEAKTVMESGQLVSDHLVANIMAEAISQPDCAKGFILDGFPRTIEQARILDDLLYQRGAAIDAVIQLQVPDDFLVQRITGRLVHPGSGRSYNIYFNPPKVENIDDLTGEPLVKRGDDTEDKLRTRLADFHSKTQPVLEHYKHLAVSIRADRDNITEISAEIVAAVAAVLDQKMIAQD